MRKEKDQKKQACGQAENEPHKTTRERHTPKSKLQGKGPDDERHDHRRLTERMGTEEEPHTEVPPREGALCEQSDRHSQDLRIRRHTQRRKQHEPPQKGRATTTS